MARRSRNIRAVWAACLLLAGANHARILLQHGVFWDYGGVGSASAAYWSSLTLADPIVAALLFTRPRVGIGATILLIATNVLHNLTVTARSAPPGEVVTQVSSSPVLLSQIGFLLFVTITARAAWQGTARKLTRDRWRDRPGRS